MSKDRKQDCDGCHLPAIEAVLAKATADHGGQPITKFVVITIGPDGPHTFGKFNTGDLGMAIDVLLHHAAEHELDGCPNCDSVAKGATATIPQYRNLFSRFLKQAAN